MADYNVNSLVKLQGLKTLAQRVNDRLANLEGDTTALRAVSVDGNTIKFFNTTDTTTTATYTVNLPEEMFLDQSKTEFVNSFTYSAEKYPDTNDPNLEGKPVLVLAVKGDSTTNYSFLNMQKLVDIYTASDTSVTITDDYKVKVNISSVANNAITIKENGLHVDIGGKIDKLVGATAGNIVVANLDGSIADSSYGIASDEAVTAMLDEVLPTVDNSGE